MDEKKAEELKKVKRIPQIGDRVRDRISLLEGIVTSRTQCLNMCDRYTVQPQVAPDKPGAIPQAWSIDLFDLIVIEENALGLSGEELERFSTPSMKETPPAEARPGAFSEESRPSREVKRR